MKYTSELCDIRTIRTMCWHYAKCSECGYEVPCSAYCGCSDNEECRNRGHRDCKELDKCTECQSDLCSDCYEASKTCKECVRKGKCVYALVHCGEKVTQIGLFSTYDNALYFADDEDVEDFYGGSLQDESFKIQEMQVFTDLISAKKKLGILQR